MDGSREGSSPVVVLRRLTADDIHQKCAEFGCKFTALENQQENKSPDENENDQDCPDSSKNGHFRYKCTFEDCGIVFMNIQDLKTHHMDIHHFAKRSVKKNNKNNYVVLSRKPCATCGRLISKNKLKGHEEDHLTDEIKYKCQELTCGWSFDIFERLKQHYEAKHDMLLSPFEKHTYRTKKEEDDVERDEDICGCTICTRPFVKIALRDTHIKNHNSARFEKCLESGCGWYFNSIKELKNHYLGNHRLAVVKSNYGDLIVLGSAEMEGVDDHNCPVCKRLFRGQFDENHVFYHDQLRFKCLEEGCGWMYESYMSMRDHYLVHHKMRLAEDGAGEYLKDGKIEIIDFSDQCTACPACSRMISRTKYEEHVESHKEMSYMYRCPERTCLWMFENHDCLTAHCFSKHELIVSTTKTMYLVATNSVKVGESECKICKRKMSEDRYAQHLLNHDDMKYICKKPTCGWMFEEFEELRQHYQLQHLMEISVGDMEEYTAEKKETECFCPLCGRRFIKRSVMDAHIEGHDRLMYYCAEERCGMAFESSSGLKVHQKRVHDIQPPPCPVRPECPICSRVVSGNMYRYHLANHHKMNLKCSKCGWRFENSQDVKDHWKSKHGLRIYCLDGHVFKLKARECNDSIDLTEPRRTEMEIECLTDTDLNKPVIIDLTEKDVQKPNIIDLTSGRTSIKQEKCAKRRRISLM